MLMELARGDERVVAITAAMPEGTGLGRFAHRWPERFFDVGICEQHAVALAGGLARGGLRPFVCIYSTFLQRAYDQIFHDAALQGLPVVMLVDRAGLVGADGPTHQGLYDIAYMRHLPGETIAAPADAAELAAMMRLAAAASGPWAIRYPRDCAPPEPLSDQPVEVGRAAVLREGPDGAILALGSCAAAAMDAARLLNGEGLRLTVASARFAKPVDAQAVARLASAHPWVLTVEDHALPGGFGSAVLEAAEQAGADAGKIHRLAVPDAWIEHDARPAQLAAAGLDAAGIAAKARLLAGRG
jgi:1-deoxy-D-xylulose-5-phosphate synthase